MIQSYLPVLFLLIVAVLFPLGLLFVTTILGPRVNLKAKSDPYECGVPAIGEPRGRFPVKFYRLAILFLLFDVEVAFLIPWAVLFRKNFNEWGPFYLVSELTIFLFVLIAGYLYAWKKGALEWD